MNTTKYEPARITNSGMGGAFYPPNHPLHTHSVETDLKKKKENRGGMSLEYALTLEYISPQLKAKIKALLDSYTPPDITLPDVCDWLTSCMRHFGPKDGIKWIRTWYPNYYK